ncbi:hypothetical protein [Amycolatopsis sp. Hca4]|uniref:hypothetical protein n=1 Tax=Amycolatopsis sp. Hca4 TaxID=2742131 RepID=UPI001590519D|nr:hypothetical protein [Amycolatopsis sp. Hca4]QKV72690.1 hypothetical protein HUT10_01645 [Amycolatopsis sp. Hca4]
MEENSRLDRLVEAGKAVIPPLTLLSALLFYFGYVSARSQYEYFGVDVDTIGLGTQDYIMRSPQPLLTPLLLFAAAGAGAVAAHAAIRRRIHPEASPRTVRRMRRLARAGQVAGLTALAASLLLLLAYPFLRDWRLYGLVTPLLIATGGTLLGAGSALGRLLRPPAPPAPFRRTSTTLVYLVVAVSAFWTTATVAQWSGRGLAMDQANRLGRLPSVILDTKESLFLRSPGVQETKLPPSEGQTFHYRYRNLRLLIHGKDRMFLVADHWSASNTTIIVPLDDSVRVQFQFQNQPP